MTGLLGNDSEQMAQWFFEVGLGERFVS